MDDSELNAEAQAREQRALEREARARAHQRDAELKAAAEDDPARARERQAEAEVHSRAAEGHREAVELQREHAEHHQG
jgi:hypothetical protein